MKSRTKMKRPDLLSTGIARIVEKISLRDNDAVETALSNLEHLLYETADIAEGLLAEVDSNPLLFDFILCRLGDGAYETVESAILDKFPPTLDSFLSSAYGGLLAHLSRSLLLPYARVSEAPQDFIAHQKSVENSAPILQALSSLVDSNCGPSRDTEDVGVPKRLAKRQAQAKHRSSAPSARSLVTETAPFLAYGVRPPTTQAEVADLMATILNEQRNILQFYLRSYRREPHSSFFRAAYLPPPPNEDVSISAGSLLVTTPTPSVPSGDRGGSAAHSLDESLVAWLSQDDIEGFGEWPIRLSTRTARDFRKAYKSGAKTFGIIVKKIKELSKGHFSNDNHKRLSGLNVGVPVYEAKMSRDQRLVYQIQWDNDIERQVIHILGVYTHAQLDARFWNAVSRLSTDQVGAEYKKRCTQRDRETYRKGDNVVRPSASSGYGSHESEALESSERAADLSNDLSKGEMEELRGLVLEGYVSFSRAFLNNILADQDVAHVFNTSLMEKEIINYRHSCIVIGRSGTGKTTTMLFKMLGLERSWEARGAPGVMKPRQLFVTQSRVLADKVAEYYGKLRDSYSTAHATPAELREMAAKGTMRTRRQRLVDADEEVYWQVDLPKRYGALEDRHFPIFLTYEHLCRLLESDFDAMLSEADKQQEIKRTLREAMTCRDSKSNAPRDRVISYKTFLHTYWINFLRNKSTIQLNPDVVFSEFLGVIQGSEDALKSETGHLTKDAYCSIQRRSLFTEYSQREAIYDLFLLYRSKKRQLWQRDAADRAFDLVQSIRKRGFPGRPVDFLYVDEAQDNLLIDTFVLRAMCPNPDGIFWAGDTAQTISAGSAFRFSELKAFLYRLSSRDSLPSAPQMFHLTTNYRFPAGIAECAASIVELMTSFWPHSVDALPREEGKDVGLKPVFFYDEKSANLAQFLSEDLESTAEFGAHQCILVRDETTRETLRRELGQIGIILTIAESKGLEFDDILLYHPFHDSPEELREWSLILNHVPDVYAPAFDEARHSGICRELKFLYVAITRARSNLWIMDCSGKGEPMRRFWTHAGLVDNYNPGDPMPSLAVSSGKDEWEDVAWSLFQKQQFSEAELAFERAGLQKARRVAHAYHLRGLVPASSSSLTEGGRGSSNTEHFTTVARVFVQCAEEAEDVQDERSYRRIAGQYYALAGDDHAAAKEFYNAGLYDEAAKHYRAAGMFDDAVRVVQQHRECSGALAESIISVAKLQFARENEIEKACTLFPSPDEAVDYMAIYGFETPRATLLEQLGRYSEAAECQLAEGNISGATRLFLRDSRSPKALSRAARTVLDGLWSGLSFAGGLAQSSMSQAGGCSSLEDLLRLLDMFQDLPMEADVRDEMKMFRAISKRDLSAIRLLRHNFIRTNNEAALLLCLDTVFSTPLELGSMTPAELASCFKVFLNYARTMQRLACHPDPCNYPAMKKLFTFSAYDEDNCLLHEGSLLLSGVEAQRMERDANGWRGVVILRRDLQRMVKDALRTRLQRRVLDQNENFNNLHSIRLCFLFATTHGHCPGGDLCGNYHAPAGSNGAMNYNIFVRIYVLQIMIYHTLYATNMASEWLFKQQSRWLRRLYEALFPLHYTLGSPHVISYEDIPELQKGGHYVITVWIKDFFNRLRPTAEEQVFLSNLIRVTRLAMLFDQRTATRSLHLIPCMFPGRRHLPWLWRANTYVVRDLVSAMQNTGRESLDEGVLFMNHVLNRKLPIDLSVLCDFMDQLCGSLIAATRLQYGRSLHDVTLPKSWVARVVRALPMLQGKSTRRATEYTYHFKDLLQQVYSGRDPKWHLFFENTDLSKAGAFKTRNALVARICKNLCLWGYNNGSLDLRREIVESISAIGHGQTVLSPVVLRYTHSTSWTDLQRTVRASTTGSDLDEMVQLWHTAQRARIEYVQHVRRIPFRRHEDLPALLGLGYSRVPKSTVSPLSTQASGTSVTTSLLTAPHALTSVTASEDCEAAGARNNVRDGKSGRATPALPIDSDPANLGADGTEDAPSLSAHELAAATTIADAFKQYWARVQAKRDSLQETRRRIYMQFREQARKKPWARPLYCTLFLGPLPHAYFALECAKGHLSAAMASTRERLKNVNHRKLEVLLFALDRLGKLHEDVSRLHQRLEPAALTYDNCDVAAIKECVLEVDEVLRAVAADTQEDGVAWQEDMDLARSVVTGGYLSQILRCGL